MRTRSDRLSAHPGKPANSRSTSEAHQHGLGLVVRMMTGDNRVEPALLGPIAKQAIALLARPLLDRRIGDGGPAGGEDGVRDAELAADFGGACGFVGGVGPERVINSRHLEV